MQADPRATEPSDADALPPPMPAWRRWAVWGVTIAAVLAGGIWGFIGGDRIAGPWLGAVMAANLALCAGLLAGAAAERLIGRLRPGQAPSRRD